MTNPGLETASTNPPSESLLQKLQEGNFQTRWEVSKQLIRLGPEIIAPLSELLNRFTQVTAVPPEPDSELDWFIAHILGELEHPTTIAPLTQLLAHPETDVKMQAANALARLGAVTLPTLQEQLTQPETRLTAVQILGQIDDDQVLPLLSQVTGDADPEVRATALAALGHFVDSKRLAQVLPVCLNSLKDPIATVRVAAINTLGRGATVATPAADWHPHLEALVEQLTPSLWDLNLEVTQQAALTLGRIGTTTATQALQERLHQETAPNLAVTIIQALGWIATPAALAVLNQALERSTDPKIQQEITTNLGRLPASLHPQATEILLKFLEKFPNPTASIATSPQPDPLLQAIVHSLGRLGQPTAIDSLIHLLAHPHAGVKFHAIAALKQLNANLSYQHLQAKAQTPDLPPMLQQGVILALQEW